ncbi:IS66 family insertion sequence element accessory protein TnpA [Pelagibaculum spongiae]|uniref:IS66 family insertion sequence element accessory protein TnpB n=1 Tax=Pelagibaculum spongiae TaxID=2080658 RepID=A0A2V1GPI6_9GAMM|nr:hypothetical protein [Pelagibaculum spongiae]PVZ64499.1 hypothetical protein DC094_19490 [Pelagibaculum spongiae]
MSVARQPRRSRKQWQALIAAFKKSDLPIEQFCQQHNLSVPLFNKWHPFFTSNQNDSTPEQFASEQNSASAFIDLASLA